MSDIYRMKPSQGNHGWCYVESLSAVADMMDGADPDAYIVEKAEMTPEEFEALPEFEGW